MQIDFSNPIQTIDEVEDIFTDVLKVAYPNSVQCEIDLETRSATIPRLELQLKGNRPIAAGWTARIALVQGSDRRYMLRDGIVLPLIAPAQAAVEGGSVRIPHDIAQSQDPWHLEYYIVDPVGSEVLLSRSLPVTFKQLQSEPPSVTSSPTRLRPEPNSPKRPSPGAYSSQARSRRIDRLLRTREDILEEIAEHEEAISRHESAGSLNQKNLLRWELARKKDVLCEIEDNLRTLGVDV